MAAMRQICALVLLTLASCDPREVPVDYGLCLDTVQRTSYFPQSVEKDLDILLVLDRSPAMQAAADAVARSLPRMVEALRTPRLGNKIPNVRIGVISADLGTGPHAVPGCSPGGDGARLLHAPRLPGCTPPTDRWISYTGGSTNVPAGPGDPVERVKQALSCIGTLGATGCRFAQPLEAARRALDPALGLNPGFLRPYAFLGLVFVTAVDDCSAADPLLYTPDVDTPLGPLSTFRCFQLGIRCDQSDPAAPGAHTGCRPGLDWLRRVEDYVTFFKGLKPPGRVLVTVVSGPADTVNVVNGDSGPRLGPSCSTATGQGTPAIRLEALADAFGDQGHFNRGMTFPYQERTTAICSDDLGPALGFMGQNIITCVLGSQCLSGWPMTRDCEPACAPGVDLGGGESCSGSCLDRADCVVYEAVTREGKTSNRVLPRCPTELFRDATAKDCGADCPCWRLVARSSCIPKLDGSPYALEVVRDGDAPRGAVAIVKCETTTHPWGSGRLGALPRCE